MFEDPNKPGAHSPFQNFRLELDGSSTRLKPKDTGIYDRLLCRDCELQRSRIESVMKPVLKDLVDRTCQEKKNGAPFFTFPVPYKEYKLFWMWTFWMFHVSTRHEAHFSLDQAEADKLKTMLAADDPGPPDEFACTPGALFTSHSQLLPATKDGLLLGSWLLPEEMPHSPDFPYRFFCLGFAWSFTPSVPSQFQGLVCQPDGTLTVGIADKDLTEMGIWHAILDAAGLPHVKAYFPVDNGRHPDLWLPGDRHPLVQRANTVLLLPPFEEP